MKVSDALSDRTLFVDASQTGSVERLVSPSPVFSSRDTPHGGFLQPSELTSLQSASVSGSLLYGRGSNGSLSSTLSSSKIPMSPQSSVSAKRRSTLIKRRVPTSAAPSSSMSPPPSSSVLSISDSLPEPRPAPASSEAGSSMLSSVSHLKSQPRHKQPSRSLSSSVLTLNLRGTMFQTTKDTLCGVWAGSTCFFRGLLSGFFDETEQSNRLGHSTHLSAPSSLASVASVAVSSPEAGVQGGSQNEPTDRVLFLDRSPELFALILEYLSSGYAEMPREMSKVKVELEIEYYGLPIAVVPKSVEPARPILIVHGQSESTVGSVGPVLSDDPSLFFTNLSMRTQCGNFVLTYDSKGFFVQYSQGKSSWFVKSTEQIAQFMEANCSYESHFRFHQGIRKHSLILRPKEMQTQPFFVLVPK